MSHSLLKGKRFFCRDWAFTKISHCLEGKQAGALVVGGPGSGKTALCCELLWPTARHGRQLSLGTRVLAYHFCEAHDASTLTLDAFIRGVAEQLCENIPGYAEKIKNEEIQASLAVEECLKNPDESFKKVVIFPLLELDPPKQTCFFLIDSIDESFFQCSGGAEKRETIAEVLSNNHHLFPQWLYLVCTSRRQSKHVTRLFTGFRKISLDDLRKSHVVRDVQQYILSRLDQEEALRHHLSKETAEMLNQLHIKSNGCFLYIEKVLDGVADNLVMLREIREIPGTLNGLYLWLCQRLFVRKQFAKVQPILNVLLAARHPLTEQQIFECVWMKNTSLTWDEFSRKLALLSEILEDGPNGTKLLFHHSFAEWLLDVKHCTQKYLCHVHEGHAMLALWHTLRAPRSPDFSLHLSRAQFAPPFHQHHVTLWLTAMDALPLDRSSAPLPSESLIDLLETSQPLGDRTLLHTMAYEGNLEMITKLLEKGVDVESVDKSGQTALNLAARQGHAAVVEKLLEAKANPDNADFDGWTPLRSAAWAGHTEVVSSLLSHGASVDLTDGEQRTALRAAAWGGHEEVAALLVEHGADVNRADHEGRTALIAAAYMGHAEIVARLIAAGAEVDHADSDGRTALSVAALCEGRVNVVSLLLEAGAKADHADKDGATPLLVASFEGHAELCEMLLEADADPDHADLGGRTPLFAAASMGHAAVVSLLLFWGAAIDAIDAEGRTVLSVAAAQGNAEVVRQLLARGLDELHRDHGGWTPLHYAAAEGRLEAAELLLEGGARHGEVDNDGRTPLLLAAQEGHSELVRTLLAHGAHVDHRAHDGKTALRVAALEGHIATVQLLLERGADLQYRDADGRSTLYLLALDNKVEMAEFLMKAGAEVEAEDLEGRTPLHVAAWQGHVDMVELLLAHHSKVDAVDHDQRTALQSAAWQGHAHIVRILLERGAQVDHTCNQGATALCIAAQEGHFEVVRTLLEHGSDAHHADAFGRNPVRVAMKGGHAQVVQILEEAMSAQDVRKYAGSVSTSSLTSASTGETKPCSASLLPQPNLSLDKQKSSNHSSSSASSQHIAEARIVPLTFTQQLQQCTRSRSRAGHILSPLSEPSPPQSPTSPTHQDPHAVKPKRNGIVTNPNCKVAPVKGSRSFKGKYYLETMIDPCAIPFKKETPL